MKCSLCKKAIKDFVKYTDKVYFYWCPCTVGSLIYRKENNGEKEASQPIRRSGKNFQCQRAQVWQQKEEQSTTEKPGQI